MCTGRIIGRQLADTDWKASVRSIVPVSLDQHILILSERRCM